MKLTIEVDDDILERAHIRATRENTTVDAAVQAYLATYAGDERKRDDACKRLLALSRASRSRRGSAEWSRDDLHNR